MSSRGAHYLELEEIPINFESINKVEGAFFDVYNFQMFTVHRGNTDVRVKGISEEHSFKMTIPPKGPVMSIKFSGGDPRILSIQRKKTHVEFVNVFSSHNQEVLLPVKSSSGAEVVNFHWLFKNEFLVLILTTGVEIYQFMTQRLQFRYLKGYSINVAWAQYFPEELTLLVCAKGGSIIHPFQFRRGISPPVMRLSKFEVDVPTSRGIKQQLAEQDVSLAKLYKALYVCVVRNYPQNQQSAEVLLYYLQTETVAKMMHVLTMHCSGRFMLSVVDNLVIVHHQASKTSMIFDIAYAAEKRGSLFRHIPVLAPLPIAQCSLTVSRGNLSTASPGSANPQVITPEMYSAKWVPFVPNVIVDAHNGAMWWVRLNLLAICTMFANKDKLIDFLLLRKEGHEVILQICRESMEPGQQYPLNTISSIFDKLNVAGKIAASTALTMADQLPYKVDRLVIDQKQVFDRVFAPFIDRKDLTYRFLVAVVVEYVRSLHKLHIPVEHFLYEMIINQLIENKRFYQLHQFLQYHVISDSRPLACLLLSRELVYPPAQQLALDMFKRLPESDSDIIDILLSSGQLLTALRFVKSVGKVDSVSARQFLEAAANEDDKMLFHTVYKFFEERNIRLRKNPEFPHGEDCKQYEVLYRKWFGSHD